MNAATRQMTVTPFNWRTLLRWTAYGDLIVLVAMGIVLSDRLPLGLAVVIAVALDLLHFRSGLLGMLVLSAVFADTAFWTLTAALSNIGQDEELLRLSVPALLAAVSIAGLVAAGGSLLRRQKPEADARAAAGVATAAVVLFLLLIGPGLLTARGQQVPQPAGLALRSENLAFSTAELSAERGQVILTLDNRDVWWHTFTIDALKVDLKAPSSGKRQVTFTAAPGRYTFYCAIPGHIGLGMRGTLTVR